MPKSFLGAIQSIPLRGTPVNSIGEIKFPQNHAFWAPFLLQKGPRPTPGQMIGPRAPNIAPGTKHIKDACRKTMQNLAFRIENGATCCKLRPKTIRGNPIRESHMQYHMGTWGRAKFGHSQLFLNTRQMLGVWPGSCLAKICSTLAPCMDSRPPRPGWILDPHQKEGVG